VKDLRLHPYQRTLRIGLALLISLTPQAHAATEGCLSFTHTVIEIQASGYSELLDNHIQFDSPDRSYKALLPGGADSSGYRVVQFDTLESAWKAVRAIQSPLHLDGMIHQAGESLQNEILPVLEEFQKANPGTQIKSRIKAFSEFKNKVFKKAAESGEESGDPYRVNLIDDLAAARIITPSLAKAKEAFLKISERFGNQVTHPEAKLKPSGYRALHLTVKTKQGPRIEIQILTERAARWSDWDHDRVYKTTLDKTSLYFSSLQKYGAAIGQYLRALDEGVSPLPDRPVAGKYGITRPEDVFPPEFLK
jgi:ppGpp synthetase/RelA/SpoT-type nucleotidyltranferase